MKIVLIGYMASGKSAVGKLLSESINYGFIDLDTYIESREGITISEIFSKKGEIYFRLKETEYLSELLNTDNDFILSVGGGTPCYANNIDIIIEKSESFYLKTSLNTLNDRLLKNKNSRPLVAELEENKLKEFIAKHLFERTPYYMQAKFSIKTDDKTIRDVVRDISEKLI